MPLTSNNCWLLSLLLLITACPIHTYCYTLHDRLTSYFVPMHLFYRFTIPCSGNRSSDVVSRVGISSRYNTQNQQCGSIVTADQVYDGAMISFVCDPPLRARYVSLEMDLMDDSVLSIAEVTVEEHSTPQCPLPAGN